MQNLRIYGFTARLSKVAESRIYEFTVLPPRPGHVRPKNLRIYGFTAAPRPCHTQEFTNLRFYRRAPAPGTP